MVEDQDLDFVGNNEHPDVPVLTYRWCRNETIAGCSVEALVDAGEQSMRVMGLKRVVRLEHHLRGDTETGQRVKMTVLKIGRQSMYLLMTAGMPGTRDKAKEINAQLAKRIEVLADASKQKSCLASVSPSILMICEPMCDLVKLTQRAVLFRTRFPTALQTAKKCAKSL